MPALNFKKQFVPLVESGEKKHTIRACRKDGRNPQAGQTLYLYTGMRTKSCRKLKEVTCKSSDSIYIDRYDMGRVKVLINGDQLDIWKIEDLAIGDGFKDRYEFADFFVPMINGECTPFIGYLIKW